MKPITGAEYLAAEKYPSLAAFVAASAETYGFKLPAHYESMHVNGNLFGRMFLQDLIRKLLAANGRGFNPEANSKRQGNCCATWIVGFMRCADCVYVPDGQQLKTFYDTERAKITELAMSL